MERRSIAGVTSPARPRPRPIPSWDSQTYHPDGWRRCWRSALGGCGRKTVSARSATVARGVAAGRAEYDHMGELAERCRSGTSQSHRYRGAGQRSVPYVAFAQDGARPGIIGLWLANAFFADLWELG